MSEQKLKQLFAYEFAFIVVPYAVVGVVLLITLLCGISSANSWWEALAILVTVVICGVPLWSGLHLSNNYRHGGRQQLAVEHGAWWWGMASVAILPVIGVGAWILMKALGDFPVLPSSRSAVDNPHQLMASHLAICILFIPLLLPLVHLFSERLKALRSNKPLNMDAPKDGAPVS